MLSLKTLQKLKVVPNHLSKHLSYPSQIPKNEKTSLILLVSLTFYDDFGIVQLLYVLMFLDLSSAQLPRRSVDSSAPSLRPWWFVTMRR